VGILRGMDTHTPPTLFLRSDGTMLLAAGDRIIEMRLNPTQLLQLGMDALQVAVQLNRATLPAAVAVLDSVVIPPELEAPAVKALTNSQVVPGGHAH
jgi:hypothetical protein